MKASQSISSSFRAIVAVAVTCTTFIPSLVSGQTCSGQIPGRHVPGPPPQHDPAASDVNLWLSGIFRPGLTPGSNRLIPAERDSTGWLSLTVPGFDSGHEIFESLDVVGDYLYVSYNAGFSIWNIAGENAEDPERILVRDGWSFHSCDTSPDCGPFLDFPPASEIDFLVEDIDVFPVPGSSDVYIAVSGITPVGISLWRFNTSSESLVPIYQDTTRTSRQVRLIAPDLARGGTTVYALSVSSNGVGVYDVTRAEVIDPCLEETGSNCPGVFLGNVGTISSGRYLDLLLRPNGDVLLSVTNGALSGQGLELWNVDPENPSAADQLFSGLENRTFGTAMFSYEGNDYLAALERVGSLNVIKIFNINSCTTGSCSLGVPVFDDIAVPPRISNQFLTYSSSNGTPFLYYGLTSGPTGAQVEQLLDLTTLGRPGQNITEMTDGGPTYFDNCSTQDLDYWPWYYPGNEFGPNNFGPRVGKFNANTNYFYRAAGGILDVHVWEAGVNPPDPTITTIVNSPDPEGLYWMTDEVTFQGNGSDGCEPDGTWTWTPTVPSSVTAVTVSEISNRVTYRFECNQIGRCDDAVVSVVGDNSDSSCSGADQVAAAITVKDPELEIVSITPGSGTFTQCTVVGFEAALRGRGATDATWSVDGIEQQSGTLPEEDLATSMPTFDWDTVDFTFGEIFSDGFETGDISRWERIDFSRKSGGTTSVDIELALDGGDTTDTVSVDLSPVTGDPMFGSPAIDSSTLDNASFDFVSTTVPGTVSEWTWELEDDNGSSLCTFGADTNVPCVVATGPEVSHTWVLQNGERRVDLTIGNCQTMTTVEESTTVTVESLEELVISSFELDRAQSNGACEIDFGCISDLICTCFVGETVFFEVLATGDPDFYDFDWDGNGTFEDANNPNTGDEYTKIYPVTLGEVMPRVRARRGSAPGVEKDLRETLDIQP